MNVTLDRMTVATELGKQEVVTLGLTSVGAFAGDVAVATSLTDSAGAALATGGLTVTGQPTVTLAANGTASAMYTVKIPSDASGAQLLANLKFNLTSAAGAKELTSAFTIAPIYTVTYQAGLAANVPAHPNLSLTISVKQGAKIRVHNADTVAHRTHGDGAFPHEPDVATAGAAGGTYEIDTSTLAIGTGKVGCHAHQSAANYATMTIK